MSALSLSRTGARRRTRAQPVEYSLLLTATLCLLAFGAVMVFSASSTTSLLGTTGDSAYYLKRTLAFGAIGLLVMRALAGRGRTAVRSLTPLLLLCSIAGLLVVLLPGIGVTVNGVFVILVRRKAAGLFADIERAKQDTLAYEQSEDEALHEAFERHAAPPDADGGPPAAGATTPR